MPKRLDDGLFANLAEVVRKGLSSDGRTRAEAQRRRGGMGRGGMGEGEWGGLLGVGDDSCSRLRLVGTANLINLPKGRGRVRTLLLPARKRHRASRALRDALRMGMGRLGSGKADTGRTQLDAVRKPHWATMKGLRGSMGRTTAENEGAGSSTSRSKRKTMPAETVYLKILAKGGRGMEPIHSQGSRKRHRALCGRLSGSGEGGLVGNADTISDDV